MICSSKTNYVLFHIRTALKHKNNLISSIISTNGTKIWVTSPKLSSHINVTRNFSSTRVNLTNSGQKVDLNPLPTIVSAYIPPHVDERFSYAYGRSIKELKYLTFAPLLDNMCKIEPHSTAVVFYDAGISKSFEQINNDINKLVNGLVNKLNVKKGNVVGIYSYNTYQYVVTQLACNKLGVIVNHFNPSYKAYELGNVLAKSDINVLFMPGKNSQQAQMNNQWNVICDDMIANLHKNGKLPKFEQVVLFDGDLDEKEFKIPGIKLNRWRSVFTDESKLTPEAEAAINEVVTDDIYGVYYTSGTTGVPKGATISQFTAINNCSLAYDRLYINRGPYFQSMRGNACVPLPLFHQFSGLPGILCPFIAGGSFVCPGMKYDVNAIYESIMRFKCNILFCTPTILIDLLDYVKKNNIDTETLPLRSVLLGGSMIRPELVIKARKEIKSLEEIKCCYGASENGVLVTLQTSQEDFETRPYTCGTPVDFCEIRIVNVDTGKVTELGESGEVQTRGYNTMIGYYNEPAKTAEVISKSRWYQTGDLGTIDKLGNLRIVGRSKDLIIKGGENIYPIEVENVVNSHVAVKEAHVFGVPDERYGEEVGVWIKLENDKVDHSNIYKQQEGQLDDENDLKKDIREFCKTRLTYNKVPKYILFVEGFPLTPTKKVKKFAMRNETIKWLKLDSKN